MAGDQAGTFVWYDLMTGDPEGAKEFYPSFTGWGLQDWDGAEGMPPYTMWAVGEQPLGGVAELPQDAREQGAPPHWLGYISVDDVDAATARVRELGGGVFVEPTDIPDTGRFAVLADPQGAGFAIYRSAADAPDANFEPGPGHFSWHELGTTDYEAAWTFYSELFGWEVDEDMDMGEDGVYRLFSSGGRQLGGMYVKSAEMPGPPGWMYYVTVADLEAAMASVEKGGGQNLMGPHEVPGGDTIAVCMDPQGAAFALHQKGSGDAG